MEIGRFTIEQLNEGRFELFEDGKINRTPVNDEPDDSSIVQTGDTLTGINPLYITDGTYHILVDAGLGWGLDTGSENADVSNVCTNLDIFDVTPSDITHVILTHLHYDHAAGISRNDENARTQAVFPNAKHYVQQLEWDFAINQVQQNGSHSTFYRLDDFYRLYADGFFELVNTKQNEVVPGIKLLRTGGHTPGHQIVTVSDNGEHAYYLGDLLPTAKYLNRFFSGSFDVNAVQAKKMKIKFLREAYRKSAFLYFYHSVHSTIGQLAKDEDKNYVLKEV